MNDAVVASLVAALVLAILAGLGVGIYFIVKKRRGNRRQQPPPPPPPQSVLPPLPQAVQQVPQVLEQQVLEQQVQEEQQPELVPPPAAEIVATEPQPMEIPADAVSTRALPPKILRPASKPAASKPAASKPAASKPAASKPAASKPAASKPAASKPAASKPAAKPAATASKPAAAVPPGLPPIPSVTKGGPWNIFYLSKGNISSSGSEGVRIKLLAGKVGSDSGGSFHAAPPGLPSRSATLSYRVFVPADFETDKHGGKLPGLCVGTRPKTCATGGNWRDDAGSLRFMFRQGGRGFLRAILYVYMPFAGGSATQKMQNAYDAQGPAYKSAAEPSGGSTGHDVFFYKGRGTVLTLRTGQWNALSMTLTINSPGASDGVISATVNGVTKTLTGVKFSSNPGAKIQSVDFTSFMGGSDPKTWALSRPSFLVFRDLSFRAS